MPGIQLKATWINIVRMRLAKGADHFVIEESGGSKSMLMVLRVSHIRFFKIFRDYRRGLLPQPFFHRTVLKVKGKELHQNK